MEETEFTAGRHQFDDLLNDKNFVIEGDRFAYMGHFLQVQDCAGMIAASDDDTDFIDWHALSPE